MTLTSRRPDGESTAQSRGASACQAAPDTPSRPRSEV